jgi:DNA-directed RNA polymerase specialized sigma24 family protein
MIRESPGIELLNVLKDCAKVTNLKTFTGVVFILIESSLRRSGFSVKAIEWSITFREVTNPKTPTGIAIYAFTRRELKRFDLIGSVSEVEILSEVFTRAHDKILEDSYKITHPASWIKSAAKRCIQEVSREKKRSISWNELDSLPSLANEEDSDVYRYDESLILQEVLAQLTPEELLSLELKVVQGKKWQDIRSIRREKGYEDKEEGALRKQKERSLKTLRNEFERIKSGNQAG